VVEIVTVYGELGAFDVCAARLTKQIEKEKTVELLVHRSACYAEAKKKKEAEADLRDAVKSFPESDVAHYYLGKFLHESGKKAEAKKHLDKANELKKAKASG
jgi:predicted Zn-dependent protease